MKRFLIPSILLVLSIFPQLAGAACTLMPFRVLSDAGGQYPSYVRNPSQCVNHLTLAANVAKNFAVPAGARMALFSADCNFYANPFATAVVPAGDVADGSASEQNSAALGIDSTMTNISVIAAVACKITSSWYR